jgi:predicted permease
VDLRHSLRRLCRSPGPSIVIIATLAVAIGANTAVLSLVSAVFWRPLRVPRPGQLVAISMTDPRTNRSGSVHLDAFDAFRAQQRSFSSLSLYADGGVARVEAGGVTADVGIEGVMPAYFDLLGARLVEGRLLAGTDDERVGHETGAIISARLRRRLFGDERSVVGESIEVQTRPVRIVGVAAPGFVGLERDGGTDVFLPVSFMRTLANDAKGPVRAPYIVGRMAPGVAFEQARAEVLARWQAIQDTALSALSPAARGAATVQRVNVEPLAMGFSGLRRQYGDAFVVLSGLAALLLAVCCVNVTGLMSAQAVARRHETAVRLALGAGRTRLFQQSLVDGLLLAFSGLGLALPLAWWSTKALTSQLSFARPMPLALMLTPDRGVLVVATLVAITAGLLMGLPAWRVVPTRSDVAPWQGRAVARTLGSLGRAVLMTQVVLALVLLVGAGLFAGMLSGLRTHEAPFRGRNIVWTRLARNPGDRGTKLGQTYFYNLVQELAGMPGGESAALSLYFPGYLGYRGSLPADRFSAGGRFEASSVTGLTEFVSPGFFRLFGIPHISGRDFTWNDNEQAPRVTVLSKALAARLFADDNAIGQRLRATTGSTSIDLEIVGVVADAPIGSIREPHLAVSFRPMMQDLTRAQVPLAHVRVSGDLKAAREAYGRVVESEGRHFVRGLFTLDEWLDFALLQERLISSVATSAAAISGLLVCIGVYGLLAYAVTVRVREIGVRMAIGATRATVLRMVLREGLTVAVTGVIIGIPCALAVASLARSELHGVSPTDPTTVVGSAVALVVTGSIASLVPALRASRTDPVEALRQE